MKVVIAGGTGFLGRALAEALAADGREVVVLTRGDARDKAQTSKSRLRSVAWNPSVEGGAWAAEIEGAAVVNLAGEPIGARRWSVAQKQRILDSRVLATQRLAQAIRGAARGALVLINGSAVGYYGPLHDEVVREDHIAGSDFLSRVCARWESEAVQGVDGTTRVACIRTGLALEKDGGALERMLIPFKLGAGGPLGSGRQYWPWIHRADWIALVRWAIDTPSASGAINATAPNPVTNADFTRALGRALHRPAFLPAPAFALRLALGEMADALLLSGQNAVPAKAEQLGFRFRYPRLDDALHAIFART
ncbi:MAG: TIGR01777 family oxidoreductase [Acidobacteriota bacterium]